MQVVQAEQPVRGHEAVAVGDRQRGGVARRADRMLPGCVLVGVSQIAEGGQQHRGPPAAPPWSPAGGGARRRGTVRRGTVRRGTVRRGTAGPARSGADDQRHHILMLACLQPDPGGPAGPLRWHLERQAGLPARVGQVILVEVRRSVLIRPDREAFRARAPVPPGHAQRRRVDQRSVTPARAAVADPVRRQRRVRAEAPLVAQRADALGRRVGRERSQAGRRQRAWQTTAACRSSR